MHLRRNIALTASALVLAATPLLSSCGFNYATDRVYTPATGVNDRDASVDVLGAVIVSAQDGSGTFIASFADNKEFQPATVDSMSGDNLTVAPFSPVKIPGGGLVNLAKTGGFVVRGDIVAGDYTPVSITFGTGETVSLTVPVVAADGYYVGLDTSGQSASPSGSPSQSGTPSDTASASPSGSASTSASASASASPTS